MGHTIPLLSRLGVVRERRSQRLRGGAQAKNDFRAFCTRGTAFVE